MKQLHLEFIDIALKYKNKIAIYDRMLKREFSYHNILIACYILKDKLARYDDSFIGIMLPASAACVIASLSTLMAGKVPVMINYSTGSTNNCKYSQDKCNFTTIITSKKMIKKLNLDVLEGMVFIEDILGNFSKIDKVKGFVKSFLKSFFVHEGSLDDTAFILFTSGSEKEPKAVQLSHKNLMSNVNGINNIMSFKPQDIFLSALPFFHVYGLNTNFLTPLMCGCSLVMESNPLAYRDIARDIKNYSVTVIPSTPIFFWGYSQKSEAGDFKTLKILIAGGDKLNQQVVDEYKNKHNADLLEGYGTTETSPVIATNTPQASRAGSVGKPLPGVTIKIIDIDTDQILENGKVGKILVKGDLVMKGYYDDLEETSLHMHNGWYDTGDMGILDKDGYLWHKGRLKRFVKVGAEMVSLAAVESELEKLLDNHIQCCVVDVPHPLRGADIVVVTTEPIVEKEVRKELGKKIPKIALPKRYLVMNKLPFMGSGKINFREVSKMCQHKLKKK